MSEKLTIVTIPGDGIGPEVMAVVLGVLEAAGVCLDYRQCVAGEAAFKAGISTGVPQETMDAIREHRIVLKGPLATPVGYGERSANVQLRRLCRTYGNIRPAKSIPGIPSRYSDTPIDLVIVRENLEGLYAGIEYMQTPDVAETLKLVSRQGCSNITRLTQFYAKTHGRKHVHCVTKANIMKLSEGILKSTFESIMEEDKDLGSSHMIVDNCAHQLVMNPEQFDVIVTGNMNGDILSDLASGLVGGLGIAASMNIGENAAIFEAVHGSAPDIVGKNMANPTALLQSAILMLRFLSLSDAADRIESALFETLGAEPTVLILCGLTMVGAAVGITRFDQWLQGVHAEKDKLATAQEK